MSIVWQVILFSMAIGAGVGVAAHIWYARWQQDTAYAHLSDSVNIAQTQLDAIKAELSRLESRRHATLSTLQEFPVQLKLWTGLQEEIARAQSRLNEIQSQIAAAKSKLTQFTSAADLERALTQAQSRLNELQSQIAAAESTFAALKPQLEEQARLEQQIKRHRRTLRELREQIAETFVAFPLRTRRWQYLAPSTAEVERIEHEQLHNALRQTVDLVLQMLAPRERQVLIWRYGLDGSEPLTGAEIGARLKISRSFVYEIEKKALRKLRHPTRSGLLRDFLDLEQVVCSRTVPIPAGLTLSQPQSEVDDQTETDLPPTARVPVSASTQVTRRSHAN